MKKIQREVMKRAWEIKEEEEILFSEALKKSWNETKTYIKRNEKYINSLKCAIEKMTVYVLSAFADNNRIYKKGISVIEENIEILENFFENKYIKNVNKKLYEVFNYMSKKENAYCLSELEKLVDCLENKDTIYNFISNYENLIYSIENNDFLQEETKSFKNRIIKAVAAGKKFMVGDENVTEKVMNYIKIEL